MEQIIPFERSYWVLPNKLLAGEIPSSHRREQRKAKIDNLLSLGVNAIINLMEEEERNYNNDLITDYLPLLEERASLLNKTVELYRFSIRDLGIPSVQEMERILTKIDSLLSEGKTIYVHCWGGVGRTGVVVGCYLLRHGYANASNVIDTISYLKRTTNIAHRDSPETEEQRNFVIQWETKYISAPRGKV